MSLLEIATLHSTPIVTARAAPPLAMTGLGQSQAFVPMSLLEIATLHSRAITMAAAVPLLAMTGLGAISVGYDVNP